MKKVRNSYSKSIILHLCKSQFEKNPQIVSSKHHNSTKKVTKKCTNHRENCEYATSITESIDALEATSMDKFKSPWFNSS